MVAWKVLQPAQCIVLDGKPCAACTEDIELEKEIKELEIKIKKTSAKCPWSHSTNVSGCDQIMILIIPHNL